MLRALLTNIQALAKNPSNKHITKQPYFDRQWGKNTAFQKSVNRDEYVVETADHTADIHDQILVQFKTTKVNSGRNTFLSKIAVDSFDFIQEQKMRMAKAKQEETLCHNSMATMMEHIFEILKSYAYELNNALGYGPLHVAATNPQAVTEIVKFNSLRQAEETVTYYRARLSTPFYSLVLRGDKKGIQFYIMPVARAIGLSKQECHFIPVMRLSTHVYDGTVAWSCDNARSLSPSMVELICMNLFQRLIEETKEQFRRQEGFEAVDEEVAS